MRAFGFYEFDADNLKKQIANAYRSIIGPGAEPIINEEGKRSIIGCVAPHAGYKFSGPVAAWTYKSLAEDGVPQSIILFGPSHEAYPGVALISQGEWETPFGNLEIDTELSEEILANTPIISDDKKAHSREHSLEVQMPFLYHLFGERINIVTISMGLSDIETCKEVGKGIAKSIKNLKKDAVVIASSDLTHYGPMYTFTPVESNKIEDILDWIHEKDGAIIDSILALDEEMLQKVSRDTTGCGVGPITSMLLTVKKLGATRSKLLKYATSFDIQPNEDAIVGYCSIILQK